jgi:hypothetical protein
MIVVAVKAERSYVSKTIGYATRPTEFPTPASLIKAIRGDWPRKARSIGF